MRPAPLPDIEELLVSPSFPDHQHDVHHRLRRMNPVYWSPALQQWLVTGYALTDAVLSDPGRFSSVGAERRHVSLLDDHVTESVPSLVSHFQTPQLNITDPPDHRRIRKAVARSFLPSEVRRIEPMIAATAARLLDEAADRGGVDLMSDYAARLPVEVIAAFIGVPRHRLADIPRVTLDQRFFFGTTPPTPQQATAFDRSIAEWHELLAESIRHRTEHPGDDVLTRLSVSVADASMSMDEAIATGLHLVIAGNSTTTALIGNTLLALMTHPDQMARVRADPTLTVAAVEESLRHEAPLPRDRRTATAATTLGGMTIEAGDTVVAVLAAANRDPDVFVRPDDFDLTRAFTSNQHAAFGRGIHFCLGATLARLEAAVAVRTVLDRPGAPLLPDGFAPEWHRVTTHRSLTSLPVAGAD